MTAPFAADLCGYRQNKAGGWNPSTSDASDNASIAWGFELFDLLGVPRTKPEVKQVGTAMEVAALADIRSHRPDLKSDRSSEIHVFDQYRHLGAFARFSKSYVGPTEGIDQAIALLAEIVPARAFRPARARLERARTAAARDHDLVTDLFATMPQDSLLKVDLSVADGRRELPRLRVALSCKWSLRTDRAQDPISQGNKLASMRRGHMPHFAVLTIEPRPSMLRLLAYGSGSIDCVYHLALPEVIQAARNLDHGSAAQANQRRTLDHMVDQGRLRPYSDLLREIDSLPIVTDLPILER